MQRILSLLSGLCLLAAHAPALAQSEASANQPEVGNDSLSELAVTSSSLPTPKPKSLSSGHAMRKALGASEDEDWEQAFEAAESVGKVATDIIEWQRLRAGEADFQDYLRFLDRNADWPGLKLLRRKGEASIPDDAAAQEVIRYFKPQQPQTGHGSLRLSEAFARTGERSRAQAVLVRAWKSQKMTGEEEAAILDSHAATVKPHHAERLSHALWQRDEAGAHRMLPLVSTNQRKLAEARLALQHRSSNAARLVRALPRDLADDPGLARDRMNWNAARNRPGAAVRIMLEYSKSKESLGRPGAWADRRRRLARQEMRNGNAGRAYRLASNHHLSSGSSYADLEWLSGYLSLRYLNKPERAVRHFRNFRGAVRSAVSLGKAGYWEGQAQSAAGNASAAGKAFQEAARQYQTSFYGLLAAEQEGIPMNQDLAGRSTGTSWQGRGFLNSPVLEAALLFHYAGYTWEPSWFMRHLAESMGRDELNAFISYAKSLGDPYISIRVGKQAARQGLMVQSALYPLLDLNPQRLRAPKELVLSIARQESEFYPSAISSANARGIMQVLPGTARDMAREIGVSYSTERLTSDPSYNLTLGSAYLNYLMGELGPSVALVAAGYNAGPRRARDWIDELGDPRKRREDIIDWIEHIPFRETRNYVMRVAESMIVYRARLEGGPVPIELSRLLKGQ